MPPQKHITISGFGAVTPHGLGASILYENTIKGKNCISEIAKFNNSPFRSKTAGFVDETGLNRILDRKGHSRVPLLSKIALCALSDAYTNADYKKRFRNSSTGVFWGSEGGVECIEHIYKAILKCNLLDVKPLEFQESVANASASHISIIEKIKGESFVSARGMHALHTAIAKLKSNCLKTAIVGACDEYAEIHHKAYSALNLLAHATSETSERCRPFDANRNGIIFSEGGSALILEVVDNDSELINKAKGVILGSGMTFDPQFGKDDKQSMKCFKRAMESAIDCAGINIEQIDTVFADGMGTKRHDRVETWALKELFGKKAYQIPIIGVKSGLGYIRCSSGLIDIMIGLSACKGGIIPPTIHYETPDPECDLDYVPNEQRSHNVRIFMVNSSTVEGVFNSVIVYGVN